VAIIGRLKVHGAKEKPMEIYYKRNPRLHVGPKVRQLQEGVDIRKWVQRAAGKGVRGRNLARERFKTSNFAIA